MSTPIKSHRRKFQRTQRLSAKAFKAPGGVSRRMIAISVGLPLLAAALWWFTSHYTTSLQNPVQLELRWPVVISERSTSESAQSARADQQGRPLTAWQQYACRKFGADCRVALAIQRAENLLGKCEIYHYNTDGTLDWGYFQINTVHLKRPDLNLRDLLDCKANIDFAYQLFQESHGFTPWSTYKSGKYLRYLAPR